MEPVSERVRVRRPRAIENDRVARVRISRASVDRGGADDIDTRIEEQDVDVTPSAAEDGAVAFQYDWLGDLIRRILVYLAVLKFDYDATSPSRIARVGGRSVENGPEFARWATVEVPAAGSAEMLGIIAAAPRPTAPPPRSRRKPRRNTSKRLEVSPTRSRSLSL
jgi:hypothetical protein